MLPETQGIHDREPLSISPFTDQANAEAFVRDHRQNLRYCHDSRRWFVWDGKVWRPDPDGEVMRRAKHTIQGLAAQMANADPEAAEAWAKHLQRSFQASRLRAIITLAQSEPGIPIAPNDFDRDPWLLNCQNGTVDLHTGELREHRQEDYCTKIVPAEFDAHAPCHKWKQFLKTITNGNEALTGFLQRVAGGRVPIFQVAM